VADEATSNHVSNSKNAESGLTAIQCSAVSTPVWGKWGHKGSKSPTVVSHLVVKVGFCTDDPKDF